MSVDKFLLGDISWNGCDSAKNNFLFAKDPSY